MRTVISMIVAVAILIIWQLIPGLSWGMSSNLWLVPVILALQTSVPFFVAGMVARIIARRRLLIHLTILWAVFWTLSVWWLATYDSLAEITTVSDFIKLNIPGILGSLMGLLLGSLLVEIRLRHAEKQV